MVYTKNMGYTPLPHHTLHESPVKKVIATVLIAMFLGIGGAYALNRSTTGKKYVPAIVSTVAPKNVSCPPDTTKVCQGGICQCDKTTTQEVAPSTAPTDSPGPYQQACTSSAQCSGLNCISGFCQRVDLNMEQTKTQTTSTCPSGTVKVCQAGECECLPQ